MTIKLSPCFELYYVNHLRLISADGLDIVCKRPLLLFATGINCISVTADISKPEEVQMMIDSIVSKWGEIHIACNNAGINMNSASEDTSLEEWDQTFNVNLRGTFMCCQVGQPL